MVEKETRNLEVLHGQSDLSSWYFIESAQIGGININVTVSLSSRLLASAGRGGGRRSVNRRGGRRADLSSPRQPRTTSPRLSASDAAR